MIGFRDRLAQRAYLDERLTARARVIAGIRLARAERDRRYLRARLRMIRRQIRTAIIVIRADTPSAA